MQHYNRRRYRHALWIAHVILATEHLIVAGAYIITFFWVDTTSKILMSIGTILFGYYEVQRTSRKYVRRAHRREHLLKVIRKSREKMKKESKGTPHRPAA